MKITCTSDLHGHFPPLPGGDLLLIAGDIAGHPNTSTYDRFIAWLNGQSYDKIIFIAGNHDQVIQDGKWDTSRFNAEHRIEYLCDSGVSFRGLKIWGSPWTPAYLNWAFMKNRGDDIAERWQLVPSDTQILVTHGPPFGINDFDGNRCYGCEELSRLIWNPPRLYKLQLHVCGHIHQSYGMSQVEGITFVNASLLDGRYRPVNDPITLDMFESI